MLYRYRRTASCILPPPPAHGSYSSNVPDGAPGQSFTTLRLQIKCEHGYGVVGNPDVYCFEGSWSQLMPECVSFCKLTKHPSVHYHCLVQGSVIGERACNSHEPSGTIVRPQCNTPNYYSSEILAFMQCVDGIWDHVALCTPECGRVTPDGSQLVSGGSFAKKGELPWHTGIYKKTFTPYMQICGGSLVTDTVVISAAHCFYVNSLQPASEFAVAVGKLYRPFYDQVDQPDAQTSDVADIKIEIRFQGRKANFQDDIALLYVAKPFIFQTYVRPVCLDFDFDFDRRQLVPGKVGKVAGWGLTGANGPPSPILKVVELPYIDISYCISNVPSAFAEYITSDKICAGYENTGTAVCQGDSGGGLVFSATEREIERYYLRGIVSTAPDSGNLCNTQSVTTFTQITKHEHFIKQHLYSYRYSLEAKAIKECRHDQWTCGDGTCVALHEECNAEVDCPDDSDGSTCGNNKNVGVSNWRQSEQNMECTWKGVKGSCVDSRRCLSTLDTTSDEKNPVCSKNGAEAGICCIDCQLVNDTRNAVVSPVTGEGIFWKDGRKARDHCLQYLNQLPYKCHHRNPPGRLTKYFDEEKKCHHYKTWAPQENNEYSYQALLGDASDLNGIWKKGRPGVIISDRFILTSGLRAMQPLAYVAVGVRDRNDSQHKDWQIHSIKRTIVHPEYVSFTFSYRNNLALLEIETPIQFNEYVLPACLPSEEVNVEEALHTTWRDSNGYDSDTIRSVRLLNSLNWAVLTPVVGEAAELVSLGLLSWGALDPVVALKRDCRYKHKVKLSKYTKKECSEQFSNYNHPRQMCFGFRQGTYLSPFAYYGDSLVVNNHISSCVYTVIGIMSEGDTTRPDLYTRVSYYVPWIEKIVWP